MGAGHTGRQYYSTRVERIFEDVRSSLGFYFAA